VLLTEVGFFSWNDVSKRYEAVVTVSNAGTGTFEVRNAFIDPAVIEIVADGCSETTVIPGGSCPITVGSNPCMNDAALVIEDTTVETPHRVELHYDRCVE